MSIATRKIGVDAKGNARRLKKGQRSSLHDVIEDSDDNDDDDNGNQKKCASSNQKKDESRKRKAAIDNSINQRDTMNSGIPVLPGAALIFNNSKKGNKRKFNVPPHLLPKKVELPTEGELDHYASVQPFLDPLHQRMIQLRDRHLARSKEFVWRLLSGFNILFYGVGNKRQFLNRFTSQNLTGAYLLEVDGNNDDCSSMQIVRDLLEVIAVQVLSQDNNSQSNSAWLSSSSDREDMELLHLTRVISYALNVKFNRSQANSSSTGNIDAPSILTITSSGASGRYSQAKGKLYIAVHSIDGPGLASSLSQACLAELASCASVGLVATSDNLNVPMLWNQDTLSKFHWVFEHIPTLLPHNDASAKLIPLTKNTKVTGRSKNSLEFIFRSLSSKHLEVLLHLAEDAMKRRSEHSSKKNTSNSSSSSSGRASYNTSSGNGGLYPYSTPFLTLKDICVKTMTVSSAGQLSKLLKELTDQSLIRMEGVMDEINRSNSFVTVVGTTEMLQVMIQYCNKRKAKARTQTQA